jgi:hypothetical protein
LHATPIANVPRQNAPRSKQQPAATVAPSATNKDALSRRDPLAFSLAETLVLDPRGFPALWGTSLDAEWAFASRIGPTLGVFVPISRAELSNAEADLHAGVAFARAGVVFREALGNFGLSGSLAAGPAWVWVRADANSPRVGGRASTVSALGSLGVHPIAVAFLRSLAVERRCSCRRRASSFRRNRHRRWGRRCSKPHWASARGSSSRATRAA